MAAALIFSLFAATPAQAAGATISGKVTKPSGNGLADSVVDLYREHSDGYELEKSVKTRSDGTYSFTSLPKDRYVVGFAAESKKYAAQYWSNAKEFEDAREISLGSSAVKGVNAKLAVGATVSGRVVSEGPSSHGVADSQVVAYRHVSGEWVFDKSTQTSSGGAFTVGGLTEGQFILEFNPPSEGPDADLALEYWHDKRAFSAENLFHVRLGETHTGFDAALSPGGRISGRVTGPDGEPVAGAPVFSYPNGEGDLGNVAITQDDGTYVMKGLSAGSHRLEFYGPYAIDDGYASEWWDDRATIDAADFVTVEAGETAAGKHAQLAAHGTAIVNTKLPTITGTPEVAARLTAEPGTWASEPSEIEYQWFADGSPIAGADEDFLTLDAAQVGQAITVEVTASRPGFEAGRARSASTAPVAKGTFTNSIRPAITKTARVGDHVLVQTTGEWEPGYPVVPARALQLLADGVEVPAATTAPFAVTPAMLDRRLSLRVQVSLTGFVPATATSEPTDPILPGLLTPTAKPNFGGEAFVGEPVTASTGTWDQSGQTDQSLGYAYQWLADGTEIDGAESRTFTPAPEHSGKALSVEVTASATRLHVGHHREHRGDRRGGQDGDHSELGRADGLGLAAGRFHLDRRHRHLGAGAECVQLPMARGRRRRRWSHREHVPSDRRRERPAHRRASDGVEARVRLGHRDQRRDDARPGVVPVRSSSNLESTGSTVTTIDLAWLKVDGAAQYRIYSGIGSGTRTKLEVGDVATARIKGLKPNTTYSIDIAALTSGGTRSPYSPRINVRTKSLVPPTALKVIDRTSTSLTLTWTKVPGVPKYRIYSGVTSSTTRTKLEVGDVGTAKITGLKPDTTYSIDIASLLSDGTRSAYSPRIGGTTSDWLSPSKSDERSTRSSS